MRSLKHLIFLTSDIVTHSNDVSLRIVPDSPDSHMVCAAVVLRASHCNVLRGPTAHGLPHAAVYLPRSNASVVAQSSVPPLGATPLKRGTPQTLDTCACFPHGSSNSSLSLRKLVSLSHVHVEMRQTAAEIQ